MSTASAAGASTASSSSSSTDTSNTTRNTSNANSAGASKKRLRDLDLPLGTIARVLKNAMPPQAQMSKEVKQAFARAATLFVLYVSHAANDYRRRSKRVVMTSEDVLCALEELEFNDILTYADQFLQGKRDVVDGVVACALQRRHAKATTRPKSKTATSASGASTSATDAASAAAGPASDSGDAATSSTVDLANDDEDGADADDDDDDGESEESDAKRARIAA